MLPNKLGRLYGLCRKSPGAPDATSPRDSYFVFQCQSYLVFQCQSLPINRFLNWSVIRSRSSWLPTKPA